MISDLVKELEERVVRLEVEDPIELALASELAGEDELSWLVEVMALPHWFDIPLLNYMLPDDMKPDRDMDFIGQPFDYAEALLDLSFVVELPQAAGLEEAHPRFEIDKAYRSQLLKRWHADERREELVDSSRRFRNYFSRLHRQAGDFEGPILEREILYHYFIANEKEACTRFRTLYEQAESTYQIGVCQALVNLAQEQKLFFQEGSTATWLLYYQGRLDLMLGKSGEARKQFENTLAQPYVRRWLRGRAQAGLGDASRADGKWSQAMREYERSLYTLLNVRRGRLADIHKMDVCQQLAKSQEQLEVARILTRMADLALAMGQPPMRLAEIRQQMELKARLEAEVSETREGKRPGIREMWRRQQKAQKASEEQQRSRRRTEQLFLTDIIHHRSRAFADRLYNQALQILDPKTGGAPEAPVGSLRNNLVWDIRYGLATVLLLQGKQDKARAMYEKLLTDEAPRHEQAELMLALGDCDVAGSRIDDAAAQYQAAVDDLQDTWDRSMWAKALHRLGRAKALQGQWQVAFSRLTKSRQIFAQLGNNREEEKVQETLRELARDEDVPDGMRQAIKEDRAGWLAHHFAYSTSSPVLNRVKWLWWPIFVTATALVTILYFLISRGLGIWFFGLFGAEQVFSLWWVNIILVLVSGIMAPVHLELFTVFRRLVGRLLPLHSVWGSQSGFVTVDDTRFTHVDYAGQIRTIAWDEVTGLRRGYSDDWVVGEASLFSSGAPGGRMLLFAPQGVLAVDASINSYLDLDELVHERVPESVQEYKEFAATFRGMSSWGLGCILGLAIWACPILFVLTSNNPSWWMIVLKVLAWAFVAFLGLGFGGILVWQIGDAIRMRRFLYPRHLPDPPQPTG